MNKTYWLAIEGKLALVRVEAKSPKIAIIWAQIQYHTTAIKVVA